MQARQEDRSEGLPKKVSRYGKRKPACRRKRKMMRKSYYKKKMYSAKQIKAGFAGKAAQARAKRY